MTLIELVAVMSIMALIFSLAIGAYLSWGRVTALSSAETRLISSLGLARQWAISHREPTTLSATNLTDAGAYAIFADNRLVGGPSNVLAHSIRFERLTPDAYPSVTFRPDGSCAGSDEEWQNTMTRVFILTEPRESDQATPLKRRIEVHRLTGHIRRVDS